MFHSQAEADPMCSIRSIRGAADDIGSMAFLTNNGGTESTKMTIAPNGNVLFSATINSGSITSTSTISGLTVIARDNMFVDGGQLYIGSDTSATQDIYRLVVGSSIFSLQFNAGGTYTTRFSISATGAATFESTVTGTNFILSSDKRLKENIKTLEPKVISAEWKSFNIKDDDSYRTGVIAQELEVKHPEFVETNEEGFKSVKYIDLLISKIAELEHRIKQLEK